MSTIDNYLYQLNEEFTNPIRKAVDKRMCQKYGRAYRNSMLKLEKYIKLKRIKCSPLMGADREKCFTHYNDKIRKRKEKNVTFVYYLKKHDCGLQVRKNNNDENN